MTAEKDIIISKDNQSAMNIDGTDNFSLETHLSKGDGASPVALKNIDTSDVSALTGETRESKAKACAAVESRKVVVQYVGTIYNLKYKLYDNERKVLEIQMKLDQALKALESATNKISLRKSSSVNSDISKLASDLSLDSTVAESEYLGGAKHMIHPDLNPNEEEEMEGYTSVVEEYI